MEKISWDSSNSVGVFLNVQDTPNCSVANGNVRESLSSVSISMELLGKMKLVNILIVTALKHSLILGLVI